MKLLKKSAIASVLLIGTMAMGTASAIILDDAGVNGSSLNALDRNGVAMLFGFTDPNFEPELTERLFAELDEVDKDIKLITHN